MMNPEKITGSGIKSATVMVALLGLIGLTMLAVLLVF